MKIETILTADELAYYRLQHHYHGIDHAKNVRQYYAFRDRILREFDSLDNGISILREGIDHYRWACKQKDARIAELEAELETEKEFGMHYHSEFMKLFEKESKP